MGEPFMDAADYDPEEGVPFYQEFPDEPHLEGWYVLVRFGEQPCGPFASEEEADAAYEGGR